MSSERPPQTESKASQRLITLAVVVAFAFGLIVPALVLAHNAESKQSEAIGVDARPTPGERSTRNRSQAPDESHLTFRWAQAAALL